MAYLIERERMSWPEDCPPVLSPDVRRTSPLVGALVALAVAFLAGLGLSAMGLFPWL